MTDKKRARIEERKCARKFRPEVKITPEIKKIFLDWCLWNVRRLSQEYWNYKYSLLTQAEFKKFWWKKGLHNYWLEFHGGLRLMAEAGVAGKENKDD